MRDDRPSSGQRLLMVGTRKAAFLFWSDHERKNWKRSVHHQGWMVHHIAYDRREGAIYAATTSDVYGAMLQRSEDLGVAWEQRSDGLDYPGESEHRVRKLWHVLPDPPGPPGSLYAGVERAGLFHSSDHGKSWRGMTGLNEHPTSVDWEAGGGGLCLHTILVDPQEPKRIYVAISTGGVYRSDDGGLSWAPKNKGVRADFLPDRYPEYGQCVHKLAMHPSNPQVLYQQNHCGVYRSDDHGDSWTDISEGLPSRFGFPCVVHAHDPDTLYLVPLTGDDNRFVPEGSMAVWRSRDRGNSWQAFHQGLPQGAYLSVLREAMAVDSADPCGVYFGTQTGQLFFSRDEGDSWELLADFLPPIYSVSTAVVV